MDTLKYFLVGFFEDSNGGGQSLRNVVFQYRLPSGRMVPGLMELETMISVSTNAKKIEILSVSQVDKEFYDEHCKLKLCK
jgi:hypothetical protein